MRKIVIIIISLFLLLSAVNFGTSKPTLNNNSTSEMDYSIDSSVIDKAQEQQILQSINRLDGFFTENRGQVGNDSVRYYIQGKGVWFLDDGVVFEIKEPINENEVQLDPYDRFHPEFEPEILRPRKSVVLKLNFEGCNDIKPKGIGLLPHRSNYFYGNDSSKWCTNVPNYQEIIYENIYDDIDLRYYSSDKGLKYDFIVHPGGDPDNIRMNYNGAEKILINFQGALVVCTSLFNMLDSDLFICQEGEGGKNIVEGRFKILNPMTYGFEIVGNYNKDRPIIIDPLIYSTYLGGNANEEGKDITIDSSGNAYITGSTYSTDFPITSGANDTIHNGLGDVFVLKLNSTGSSLIYSTFVGSVDHDYGKRIEIDTSNNAYVMGETFSTDFPVTIGANKTIYNGGLYDLFLFKLNQMGSLLLYSSFIGGSNTESGGGIDVDLMGNAYITGWTNSLNFPTTVGANDTTFNGWDDVFVLKMNPTGSMIIYSTFIGGSNADNGMGIAVDSSGNTYVSGSTSSPNFPTTPGANDTIYNGWGDCFVFKLNSAGSLILYSTFIGGSDEDDCSGIAIDSNNNAYITGDTSSTDFPNTTGAYNPIFNGNSDAFVLKLNQTGSSLLYSTFIGGSGSDEGRDIATDIHGNSYITGWTGSTDFPITPGAYDSILIGAETFVSNLDSTGSLLMYSTFVGGNDIDMGWGIAVSLECDAFVTGRTQSFDFPTTPGANDTTFNGGLYDVFIYRMKLNIPPHVVDLKISDSTTLRINPIYLHTNATDIEDSEHNLTPFFEYRDPNEQVWNSTYFSALQYQNSRWEVSFTPPKNATLGLYDFRVKFNDTGGLFSNWLYLNDSLLVLNNIPAIEDTSLSNNSALLGDSISIWINSTDIEEIEENLTIELEYRDSSETSWDKTDLSAPMYNNGRWDCSFNIPFDALFGYYDFRVRVNDSDGNYSSWLYLNDSLLVYNSGPKVIDAGLSETSIYRTESVSLYINGTDYETPEDMLSCYSQYKPQSESKWTNLTSNYLNNRYEVSLTTYIDSILGNYDFRVKFEDNESVSSGWKYINDSLEVLNNLPIISENLDNISVGIQPLLFDLTSFESDIEDTDENLTWSIEPQVYTYIKSIEIIDTVNDTLKITPKENIAGTEDIELVLTDKDSGIVVKSDISIIVDSTISEFTPKVTLLTPPDKTTVDTLTPTLKWKLDYSGTEFITYSVTLDESPDPHTTIKAGLTSTEYTLENELVDGKTYYWEVEPTNGVCLSGLFRFTIDLGFEPIYKVNLTTERDSVTIKQGESKVINLTVKNEGNSIDNFKIELSSDMSQSDITIEVTNGNLEPDSDSIVILSIDIPDDFTIGDYTITVTATSLSDITAKDEVNIDVKVVSEDFEPDYDVSISISPSSLNLKPSDSENVTITITNDGNIEDDFNIKFESDDFTSADIQFSKSSFSLTESDSGQITVTITIPEDMEPGEYTIRFIVESEDASEESTLTITVKDGDEPKDGDKDNTMLYALIGIIVIITVVLILLFIFLKKKKGKEEEQIVEEAQPPPPEEVPPEQVPTPEAPIPEQPTAPEVPPEQPPAPEMPPPEQPATPEVTPQIVPQVKPAPQPAPMPQVEEEPVPQVEQHPQVAPQESTVVEQSTVPQQLPVPKNPPE